MMCVFFYSQPPSWIEEMITHTPWRKMFYELADKYPDCLMLNFTIKVSMFNRVKLKLC